MKPRDRIVSHATYERLRDFLACGWIVMIPNGVMHHNFYGVQVEWLCDCPLARPK